MIHRLILLGLLTAGFVQAETFKESFSETHPLKPQGKVQIENESGSILIRTWDRAEVSLQVEKAASSEDFLKAIEVEIKSDPNSLSIKTTMPKFEIGWREAIDWVEGKSNQGRVQLTLMVPATAQLGKIASTNGSITLEGTHGLVEASTVNGTIRATGLHEGALKTVNGAIRASVDQFNSGAQLAVSTVNGAVTVQLPKGVGASINLSTINGGVSCDFPLETETDVSRNSLAGVIGAGGGSIRVRCVNGAVRLQSL